MARARILICGGRHGANHISTHLNACQSSSIMTIVLDGSHENCSEYLKKAVTKKNKYQYVHEPGLNYIQRIKNAQNIICTFKYITLVAVDDLIFDESINDVISNNVLTKDLEESIIIGFGPDVNYMSSSKGEGGRLNYLPKNLIAKEKIVGPHEYWSTLKRCLAQDDPLRRLFGMVLNVGFFPFVYSTYQPDKLLNVIDAHINAMNVASIDANSAKASILFEFLIVSISTLASPIYVTTKTFRLGNYTASSEGGNLSYNHRTMIANLSDQNQNSKYFKSSCDYLQQYIETQVHAEILQAAYSSLCLTSLSMAQCIKLSNDDFNPSMNFQREALIELLSSLSSHKSIEMIKYILMNWRMAND